MTLDYCKMDEFMDWIKVKSSIKFNTAAPTFPVYYNCIYWAYMGCNIGSEEGKHRPVLITRTYKNSPTITVIPLTTQRLHDACQYHIDLEELDSTALCEQMRVIDIRRLDKPMLKKGKIISITQKDWDAIDFQVRREYLLCKLPETKK